MSLFLIYFEFPSRVAPPAALPPLVTAPLDIIALTQARSFKFQGLVLTDGHSSERLLLFGTRVAARRGEQLRTALFDYIRSRLASGAIPYMEFAVFPGQIKQAKVQLDDARSLTISALASELAGVNPSELIKISGF